uniref:Uncharacterized protein n=1 Tax=Oryza punctata TaxID=4537 RepID=A0A0E0M5B0_ORYPU
MQARRGPFSPVRSAHLATTISLSATGSIVAVADGNRRDLPSPRRRPTPPRRPPVPSRGQPSSPSPSSQPGPASGGPATSATASPSYQPAISPAAAASPTLWSVNPCTGGAWPHWRTPPLRPLFARPDACTAASTGGPDPWTDCSSWTLKAGLGCSTLVLMMSYSSLRRLEAVPMNSGGMTRLSHCPLATLIGGS